MKEKRPSKIRIKLSDLLRGLPGSVRRAKIAQTQAATNANTLGMPHQVQNRFIGLIQPISSVSISADT